MTNIREREIRVISKMLDLADGQSQLNFGDQWKVLVYDQACRDIISPLLNVGALRAKGVTLHMLLHSDREAVPDAPAVYFVRPTEANLKRIAEDCAKNLYRSVYLNFVSRIERPLLEKFAQDLVATNCVGMVTKIVDQYLDVIALEPNLFTLNIQKSFVSYNAKGISEKDIQQYMSSVSSGLLSAIRVMGVMPVIRAPPGGAAEMLAQNLGSLLRENIGPRGPASALFGESLSLSQHRSRPLLVVIDRSTDMCPPIQHNASYQALIDDLLEHRLNRVTIDSGSKAGGAESGKKAMGGAKKTYDLNTQADAFFGIYAGEPFPEAVEANEKELADVSQRESEIRARPGSTAPVLGAVDLDAVGGQGADLSAAIESLPQILAKKANLEAHTNMLQAVMSKIASREIPTFFEVEQSIVSSGRVSDKAALLSLIRDGGKGSAIDKARLLLVIALTSHNDSASTKEAWAEFETAFVQGCAVINPAPEKQEVDELLTACSFARKLHAMQSGASVFGTKGGMGGGSSYSQDGENTALSSFLEAAGSKASSLVAKATAFFTKFSPLYVSRVVDLLSEGRSCPENDTFVTIDPRSKPTDLVDVRNQTFSDVIVFVLGGGCYSEYFNLQELRKCSIEAHNTLRTVVYGSTELYNAEGFLAQLTELSKAPM